jgi:hypothetical protein
MQEIVTENNEKLEEKKELGKEIVMQNESKLSEEKEEMEKKPTKKDKEKLDRIKILQEQINNENFLIKEYDTQLSQLKKTDYKPSKRVRITVKEKESIKRTNNLISKLKSKNNSLLLNLDELNNKQNLLELGTTLNIQEKNRNKDKLRKIKSEKEVIQNKIKEINNQIKIILDNEKNINISVSKATLQRNYTNDIEEKNYIYNKLPINKLKSPASSILQSIEELEKKEEEEKEAKKFEKYQYLRNRELEIIRRRKNKIDTLTKVTTPKYIPKRII